MGRIPVKYLIHADGALPNLALMKLARYFRTKRAEPRLIRGRDRELWDPVGAVYGSSVFAFSAAKRARIERTWGAWGPICWGGTGVRVSSSLDEIDSSMDWEKVKPDYRDYPDYQFSIGFSQRGCRLSCKFCVVPKKEGKPEAVHSIRDIWRGGKHPRKIVLLDNDFFGQPREAWRDRIAELQQGGFKVNFNQGINIRMVDEESARAIASVEYRDRNFQRRVLYTAWDNLGDERRFKKGVEILKAAGIPPRHVMAYMLVGYAKGETMEQLLYRFNEIVALGCLPYPMVYDQSRPDLKAFQRWAVRGLYRAIPWEKYRDPRLGRGSNKGLRIADAR